MPGQQVRTRAEIEAAHNHIKAMVDGGAKALGRAKNLDTMIEILLDIRDEIQEMNTKLTTINSKL